MTKLTCCEQVGDGPRVRTTEEALVDATGFPKSVAAAAPSTGAGAGAGAGAASGEVALGDLSLEMLVGNLVQQIQGSDWLEKNPPTGESIFPKKAAESADE